LKNLCVLGSTGSIGISALEVVRSHPDKYRVVGLAAGKNVGLLMRQIDEFQPKAVAVFGEDLARELSSRLSAVERPQILFGQQGYVNLATTDEVDMVISAIMGAAGLRPTYSAIRAGKDVALANKETMVMAGALVMAESKTRGISLLPIDSEHSAILQSLQGHRREDVRRVILTASGGPFKDFTVERLREVTRDQALRHPNWDMGSKITIDSATLMNKGLEVIEAKWLFDLSMDQITILIHPQSIVHSMVEYLDGSIIAQLGIPDMTVPISYALSYPEHLENQLRPLELEKIGTLHFEEPDMEKFKGLALALKAAEIGDSMPTVLNGANEIAVHCFLEEKIAFLDIPEIIERTMEAHEVRTVADLDDVLEVDKWARETTKQVLRQKFSVVH
jgi:1-deoxy-D-xylulose-5-phosphate reductoisomerase